MEWDEYAHRLRKETTPEMRKRFHAAHKAHPTDFFDHTEGVFPKGVKKSERHHFSAWHYKQMEREARGRRKRVENWKKRTPLHKRVALAVRGKHPGWNEKASIPEAVDEIERRHEATNARIRAGAKKGKFWLLRSEEQQEVLQQVIEDTMASAIGGFNMPMGINKDDPAMGGRNRFTKQQLRFALGELKKKKSSPRQ
jgi:hypothetical protein